jgi:hypothetical protein
METNETNKLILEKCLSIPLCTCGKCIVKREKKDHFYSLPYSSKLASMYQNDFNWKNPRTFKTDYLKATHSAMENSYRKNIPGCLVTTNKTAYKPFKVSLEGIEKKTKNVESVPFYGSTTYENTYINYGSTRLAKGLEPDDKVFKVNFRGKSLYTSDFRNYDTEDYMKKNSYIYYKPTLKFVGEVASDTEFNQNFLPVDYNQPAYFGGDKLKKSDLYKSQMIPCPFPKSNFESITRTAFVDHFQRPCRLREYMTKNNITTLEI